MCESFFATLETELLDRQIFRTHAQAKSAIFEFIESWYNRRRRHQALDYLTPAQFETVNDPNLTLPAGWNEPNTLSHSIRQLS